MAYGCLQNQGTSKLILNNSGDKGYNLMLEALGTCVQKLHVALQGVFQSIEKARASKKPTQIIIPLPPVEKKSKWQRIRQRKMRMENAEKRQKLQPTIPLKTLSQLYEQQLKVEIIVNHEPKAQSQGMKRQRRQLFVSLQGIRAQQREVVKAIKERLGLLVTSFNLPNFITITDQNIINSVVFQAIYDTIFRDQKAALTNFNKTLEPIIILQGKMRVHPQAFKQIFNGRDIQEFSIQLQQKISQMAPITQQIIKDRALDMQLQPILKKLRRAKIYRHSFNTHVQGLMGSYLFLRKGKPLINEHPQTNQNLQLSDVGLLSDEIRVDSQQEAEIVGYWLQKGKTLIQKCYSKYDYNYSKALQYLKIDRNMPLTFTNYLHLLSRFQERLIQVEDERNAISFTNITQSLAEVEQRFDALAIQASVVRDGRSALRKPTLPQPSISASTPLRVFAKWRSYAEEDGHSLGSIMARFIDKTLPSFEAALSLLLRDYDTQVTMPRKKFQMEMLTFLSQYDILCRKLQEEEEEYRRFIENTGLRTPRKGISPQEPLPAKKQSTPWDKPPIPYSQELPVEQAQQEQQSQDEESQSGDDDWQYQDQASDGGNSDQSSAEEQDDDGAMDIEAEEEQQESVQDQNQQGEFNSVGNSLEDAAQIPIEEEAVMGDILQVESKSSHSLPFGDLVPIEEMDSDQQSSDSEVNGSKMALN